MDFQVELPRESGGNYGLLGYIDNILVLDGFYPAIPVYDEKGWHAGKVPPNADSTFQDASFYMVRVTAPANLIVIASGIQVDQTKTDNRQIVTFAAGPARDFYLAASDRFAVVSETVGETKVNSYAFKDRTEGAQLALRTATNALKSYSARFGTYPYTEFDVVSTPMQNAYGIEYPGITGINYAMYDLGATIGGLPASVMLESTVAHEVGHQWFYNVVGNDQINEPWLDESAVQYITDLYFLDMYGQQGMASYRDSWLSRWDRVNRELIPIGMPAGSYQGKEYGAIVYGRGPLFVEALAQKMGQATFDQFLRDYAQSHKWGIGTAASFKQLAEKQCQCDLTPLFDEWVYKKATMTTPTPSPTLSGSGGGVIAFSSLRDNGYYHF
jgi:aminopeptidase N